MGRAAAALPTHFQITHSLNHSLKLGAVKCAWGGRGKDGGKGGGVGKGTIVPKRKGRGELGWSGLHQSWSDCPREEAGEDVERRMETTE